MVVEIYLLRLIIYCFIAFLLGYSAICTTLTKGNHEKGKFDFFYIFKSVNLPEIFERFWKGVVSIVKFTTGIELEVFGKK